VKEKCGNITKMKTRAALDLAEIGSGSYSRLCDLRNPRTNGGTSAIMRLHPSKEENPLGLK
jgi:hypothetical protein